MEKVFAIISEENFVENIIIAESAEVAEAITEKSCIEITENNPGGIGDFWNGTSFIFVEKQSV